MWGQMDLHLDLAAGPGRSLRARLEYALREAVRSGRLAPETRLPSTRELCGQLGVSRGVVVDAYAQLAAEGYLRTRRGGGTTVAPAAAAELRPAPAPVRPPPLRYDMSPYRPALSELPRRALAGSVARVLREAPDQRFDLPDPAGVVELRTALASYLGRVRGVRASAEQIVITTGTRHGAGLAWRALATRGARRVGVEDPGWDGMPETALAAGLEPVPVPVDAHGLVVESLDAAPLDAASLDAAPLDAAPLDAAKLDAEPLDAVAVAPAHQYPTGGVLSAERRRALLGWARDRRAFVIEDDFDAEYRYDHQPIGSLQGLAPEHVIYTGSTSKTMAPSLRLGWLVVPMALVEPILRIQQVAGTIPSPIFQLAFADVVARGELDRHLRRQRRRYRRRRDALLAALAAALPALAVTGAAAGLYVVLELPDHLDEAAVLAAARARGIALEGRGGGGPALVIGYAGLNAEATAPAVAALAGAIEDASKAWPGDARPRGG
jgi:GntR family transcriptional regulator/MocR family aminotransferase